MICDTLTINKNHLSCFIIAFTLVLVHIPKVFAEIKANSLVPLADVTIQEVRTREGPSHIFRLIVKSESGKANIFLEKFQKDSANQKPPLLISSWKLRDIKGGDKVKIEKGWSVSDFENSFGGFKFLNSHVSGSIILMELECVLRTSEKEKEPSVLCNEAEKKPNR